ncbi:MAG: hypothetical protein ACYTFA_00520 [Planctomycetota bacterium]
MRQIVRCALVLLLCSATHCTPASLPPTWMIQAVEPRGDPLSDEIVIVADNQLHNIYSKPVTLYRTAYTDLLVARPSIRSALLDFYGQDALRYVASAKGQLYPIVHLGDACDFSCTGEFMSFFKIMQEATEGWVMAPGNHDGFFFGNAHRSKNSALWLKACDNASEPMTKDRFVRYYLAALIAQRRDEPQTLLGYFQSLGSRIRESDVDDLVHQSAKTLRRLIPDSGHWKSGGRTFLREIVWEIDERQPWRSFVVQRLSLRSPNDESAQHPRVGAILLDTANYAAPPTLIPLFPVTVHAGHRGEMLETQLEIVREWLANSGGELTVLMGHHPYDWLRARTRKALSKLCGSPQVRLYVSAHTHDGDFIVHGKGDDAWLELNVGSILDWPLEYRRLFLGKMEDGRVYIRSPRRTVRDALTGLIEETGDEWQVTQNDDDYYLSHADLDTISARKTEIVLKKSLLATHRRMLDAVPTAKCAKPPKDAWPTRPGTGRRVTSDEELRGLIDDAISSFPLEEQVSFLVQMKRFEDARLEAATEDGCDYKRFRMLQAVWASKYDWARARKPYRGDTYIVLPEEY